MKGGHMWTPINCLWSEKLRDRFLWTKGGFHENFTCIRYYTAKKLLAQRELASHIWIPIQDVGTEMATPLRCFCCIIYIWHVDWDHVGLGARNFVFISVKKGFGAPKMRCPFCVYIGIYKKGTLFWCYVWSMGSSLEPWSQPGPTVMVEVEDQPSEQLPPPLVQGSRNSKLWRA